MKNSKTCQSSAMYFITGLDVDKERAINIANKYREEEMISMVFRLAYARNQVELSYLNDIEQRDLLQAMELNDCTPSLSQAVRMKKLSQQGRLDDDKIGEIMAEEKANQKERIKIPTERVRKYFPKSFSNSQIEDAIVKMCEVQYRKRQGPER